MKLDDREISLSHGSHKPEDGGGCVMEIVGVKWLMRHGWSLADAWNELTDSPPCTDPMVYMAAQRINDRLTDDGLSRLELRVDRLMSCHSPSDAMKARRVRVRVACWAARRVLHLVSESRREVALRSIETAEAWLRGEADEAQCRAASAAADAAAYAARSAYASAAASAAAAADAAVAAAAYVAAYASAAASASAAADAARDDALLDFLDELIDQWEKACALEGTLGDEPPIPRQVNGS